MRLLIVKTSSLGDIIQAFAVLSELTQRVPHIVIDWVVEERWRSLVEAHPLIHRTHGLDLKGIRLHWKKRHYWYKLFHSIAQLRQVRYDVVLDLQGNSKSGLVTCFSRGKEKVGFSWSSLREWPNGLATHTRFKIPIHANMRLQYLSLVQSYLATIKAPSRVTPSSPPIQLRMTPSESKEIEQVCLSGRDVMICPSSKWINKQLPLTTWIPFLQTVQSRLAVSFFIVSGEGAERLFAEALRDALPSAVSLVQPSFPLWQNLMSRMLLLIAVDSSALHLAGTTDTPSFSLFGPTDPHVFKPLGTHHGAYQGPCPYGRTFVKQCPLLRSCVTGACLRHCSAKELEDAFFIWWNSISKTN